MRGWWNHVIKKVKVLWRSTIKDSWRITCLMTWPPSDFRQPSKSEGNKYEKEHFHPEYPATSREKRDYPRMDADFLENSSKNLPLVFSALKKGSVSPSPNNHGPESARIRLRLYRIQALLGTTQLFQLKGGNLRTTKKKTESTLFWKGQVWSPNISHRRRLAILVCSNMTGREIQGWCCVFPTHFPYWLVVFPNQPIWKICPSQNGNHLPQIIGVKIHKIWTKHHLGQFGLLGIVGWCKEK